MVAKCLRCALATEVRGTACMLHRRYVGLGLWPVTCGLCTQASETSVMSL
jgi:hypothetical protein